MLHPLASRMSRQLRSPVSANCKQAGVLLPIDVPKPALRALLCLRQHHLSNARVLCRSRCCVGAGGAHQLTLILLHDLRVPFSLLPSGLPPSVRPGAATNNTLTQSH